VPQRKHYLFVCTNHREPGTPKGSCATRGSVAIHAAIKAGLAARGLAKAEARACTSSCTDVCWAGPIVAVEPDGYFYGRVTIDDVPEILDALAAGTRVERLVLGPHEFEAATAGPMLPEHVAG
jgi:(2Fe-2S) ferredoxin